jgi:hypothetical protein
MHYELWDTQSRNMLDDFASEADVLAEVRMLVETHGPSVADTLVLGEMGDDGRTTALATGQNLVARALGVPDIERRSG